MSSEEGKTLPLRGPPWLPQDRRILLRVHYAAAGAPTLMRKVKSKCITT